MSENPIFEQHLARNQSTKDFRESMVGHRQHVMKLLRKAKRPERKSLAIFGAGNANDLDLAELANLYERITLIDLDTEAMKTATRRVPDNLRGKVEVMGCVDLTGVYATLAADKSNGLSLGSKQIQTIVDAAATADPIGESRFDVVVSACMISQVVDSIGLSLSEQHERYLEVVLAVRDRHLELIAKQLNPDGIGILVSDFVSNQTALELDSNRGLDLREAARKWIRESNFFTGCNPNAISKFLFDSRARLGIDDLELKGPWRWDIGTKVYAVFGVVFRKA